MTSNGLRPFSALLCACLVTSGLACRNDVPASSAPPVDASAAQAPPATQATPAAVETDPADPPSLTDDAAYGLPPGAIAAKFTGDFDAMLERRMIRIAAPYSRSLFYLDKGRERGIGAELVRDIARKTDQYRLCFVRGPEGIVLGLAEQLR